VEETIVLAKVDPKQVTSLLPAKDGNIYIGMANVGGIATIGSGYARAARTPAPSSTRPRSAGSARCSSTARCRSARR
jgi:hypothetical protein